jgi:hypothetical protein
MTGRDTTEHEIRALVGEAVGALWILSEGLGPLTGRGVRELLEQARHALAEVERLSKQLP